MTKSDDLQRRLRESRQFCLELTKAAAKNFYYGLKLLPEPKRSAMFALYAYMRLLDDIADEEDGRSVQQRSDELEAWRDLTHSALDGRLPPPSAVSPLLGGEGYEMWPTFAAM